MQFQPVKQDQGLVVPAAANREVSRVVSRREARDAIDRAEDVLADLGHRLDVVPGHRLTCVRASLHE